ncbi:MAG TPA: sigma-54 dependent transcriptional regulator [Vicinamibacterales bacterium]|jgi:DNA-binding NtrC family response regulator
MDNSVQIVGASAVIRDIEQEVVCASRSEAKVLITGESGVGKEIVARMIHQRSRRAHMPLVTINCAGVPDSLLESELFGHVRGSFTDAYRDKRGWLEQAQGGTIFLDEVGEMSLRMQALLLRFLENGEIQRVGSERVATVVDVRVISATNRNLLARVGEQSFREDLYYRLNVIHVAIPPLRERKEDVAPLFGHFFRTFSKQYNVPQPTIAEDALRQLTAYHWPGNVRELKNVAERLVVRSQSGSITLAELPREICGGHHTEVAINAAKVPAKRTADMLLERMSNNGESFWSAVYEPFMRRDITREDVRAIVSRGLDRTRGNYKALVVSFNLELDDYKRFLSFLRKYQCHMPFQQFRAARVRLTDEAPAEERLLAKA